MTVPLWAFISLWRNPENSDGDDVLYDSLFCRTSVEAFAYLEGGIDAVHALQYPPDVKSVCDVVRDVSIPVGSSDLEMEGALKCAYFCPKRSFGLRSLEIICSYL